MDADHIFEKICGHEMKTSNENREGSSGYLGRTVESMNESV